MVPKKTDKANLENKKSLFLQIGYVIALGFLLLAFEWTKEDLKISNLGSLNEMQGETEIIPITRQEPPKPETPPKPKQVIIELNIVQDDVELDDELNLADFSSDQNDIIEIVQIQAEEEEQEEVFYIVEDMPQFQGGDLESFRNYIQANIKYPTIALENAISGTVYVNFVVNARGEIANITIVRGVDSTLDNEVVRALKAAPKWVPGKQRGKPVSVSMSIPVRFILQ